MHDLIQNFPNQLEDAVVRYRLLSVRSLSDHYFSQVVCAGLGGSGIAASLMQSLGFQSMKIPYLITKSYEIPSSVGPETLFIASSHSGNTEETLSALYQAYDKGATIVIISSGGVMKQFAIDNNCFLIQLPDGMMPRACYTYAVVAQLFLLTKLGLMSLEGDLVSHIHRGISLILDQEQSLKTQADDLATIFANMIPVIYSDNLFEPVAMRFRQQLNENAKMLCRHAVLPEMNHNEVLGWYESYEKTPILMLRHSMEHERTTYRMELLKEMIGNKSPKILELRGYGQTILEQIITMTYILDWVSVYISDIRGLDPTEISSINFLKGKLAEKK